jgi:hypothetical protein
MGVWRVIYTLIDYQYGKVLINIALVLSLMCNIYALLLPFRYIDSYWEKSANNFFLRHPDNRVTS